MSGCHLRGFLVLLFTLPPSESTTPKLNSIKDLKTIAFGQSVPTHSLVLLHWFANTIEFDNNDAIELTFEPDQGDYGTHHYGNYEQILAPLPRGHRYYTLGNLNHMHNNQGDLVRLPSYVTSRLNDLVYGELNRDRIVFRLRHRNRENTIDRVYMTQHYETNQQQGTRYDPEHTYQITANLLRELRVFSLDQSGLSTLSEIRDDFGSSIDDEQLRSLRNKWGELACLGLLVFIVISEKNLPRRPDRAPAPAPQPPQPPQPPQQKRQPKRNLPPKPTVRASATPHTVVNIPEYNPSHNYTLNHHHQGNDVPGRSSSYSRVGTQMSLEVRAGNKGKARVYWNGVHVPQGRVMLVLFKNDRATSEILHKSTGDSWGDFQTSVALNKGLQVRLHETRRFCCFFTKMGDEISRGPEYHNARAEGLVSIAGFDVKLNLFVKDGTACARLYIPETFTDWKNVFWTSWVGFYTSQRKQTNQYETWQWQWATKFVEVDTSYNSYNVYEYHSSVAVAPGVHARFIDNNGVEQARTPAWA